MSRLFETIVLCLSLLAFSAQGFAAPLDCGLVHQHTTTVPHTDHNSAQGHANKSSAVRHNQLQAVVSLGSIDHVSSDEAVSPANGDRGQAKAGEPGAHESSEHAACSVGAAVPASSLKFQPAEQTIVRIASKQFPSIGFVTDGPTRPPRSFPA